MGQASRVRCSAIVIVGSLACASSAKRSHDAAAEGVGGGDAARDATIEVAADATSASTRYLIRGGRLPDGTMADLEIADGKIVRMAPHLDAAGWEVVDAQGSWLAPAFIDSHVHLTYWSVADTLVRSGIAGAVDLAAPIEALARSVAPLRLISSGPMVTAVDGYPLDSWGANGYGVPCATIDDAVGAVNRLVAAGAGIIKMPIGQGRALPDDVIRAAVERAHSHGRKVAVHAVDDEAAARAARLGADVLAHTPITTLTDATIIAWRGRAVVSTLAAFGGGPQTVENLRRLRAAGVTVLYGTDLGNRREPRVDPRELELLRSAGLDGAAVLAAGTSAPAAYWGWTDLGVLAPGRAASLMVLAADPVATPDVLSYPTAVIIDGVRLTR